MSEQKLISKKADSAFSLMQKFWNASVDFLRFFWDLMVRSVEVIRFEGLSGFRTRTRRYLRRRIRGKVVSDFSKITADRRVFRGAIGSQSAGLANHSELRAKTDLPCAYASRRDVGDQLVDIVVCVHNALGDVVACLDSLEAHGCDNSRLIIVDDGSEEETKNFLQLYAEEKGVRLIRNEYALGYTLAANQGMRASSGDYVVLLNSDTVVTSGWIEGMVECASSDPVIGLVGPLSNTASWQSIPSIESNGDWAHNELPEGISIEKMGALVKGFSGRFFPKISFLNGFCLLIKRDVIERIGVFDDKVFGNGYGEENDYCLRARQGGYELVVADNVFIYHAQSKSYGTDRRKELAKRAGYFLAKKHGQSIIDNGVIQCRYDRVLMGLRARAKHVVDRDCLINSVSGEWSGKRVLFVLPVSEACGGANVVITEGKALMRLGVHVEILNLSRFKSTFESSYGDLGVPVAYVGSPEELISVTDTFDVVVATANHSVQWLLPLQNRADVKLAYYIQDFEPLFFEETDPRYTIALQSYALIPNMKLLTKTDWNSRVVLEHTGLLPEVIGPSVDVDLFRPRTQYIVDDSVRVRVAAMLRPSSPRRNAVETIEVLLALQERFGRAVEIVTFGSESHGPPLPERVNKLDFRDYGHLSPRQMATLLETVDIFLDMSTYQAMGLTAMEAMACGVAVVVPENGGATSFAINNENSLVIDTRNIQAVVDGVSELVGNPERRRRLQERAIMDINRFFPEKAASNFLSYVFAA